jgi:hypothetical protein
MPPHVPPGQQRPPTRGGGCATADIAGYRPADRREPLIPQQAAQPPPDPDRVFTFAVFCRRVGISPATGRRLFASGRGPRVTWLSPRRMGIRERHFVEWLDANAA